MEGAPNRTRQPLLRLILTGFMGAGKSTVGALLAQRMGWRFIDLDDVIEANGGHTIAEIFRRFGESDFRQRERLAVEQSSQERQVVLALGGGTVEDEATRSLLLGSPGNCLVFLDAPLVEMLARCDGEGKVRPLLSSQEPLEARHQRRLPHYRSAHVTVETTGLAPPAVARRVLELVSQQWIIEANRGK